MSRLRALAGSSRCGCAGVVVAAWCGIVATAGAQSLDPKQGAASLETAERCGSVVIVNCPAQAGRPAPTDARFEAMLAGSQRKFERRRTGVGVESDPYIGDGIVVTAERIQDPREVRWEEFATAVRSAQTPECLHAGEGMGLFAPIVVPIMALKDKCR